MYREARERIIAVEIMKLERRQAMERARRSAAGHVPDRVPRDARRTRRRGADERHLH